MQLPEPHTESQLFDYLNEAFGVGGYDALAGDKPWYKVRSSEIGKLKKIIRARRVSVREVYIAGEYCRSRHIAVLKSQDIFQFVDEAMRDWRKKLASTRNEQFATSVQEVIEEAYAAGELDFAFRLVRADRVQQQGLIREWRGR